MKIKKNTHTLFISNEPGKYMHMKQFSKSNKSISSRVAQWKPAGSMIRSRGLRIKTLFCY